MKIVVALATSVLALAAGSAALAADGVLDQANNGTGVELAAVGYQWQQQITAGVSGRLTAISLWGFGKTRVRIAEGGAFNTGPFVFSQAVDFGALGSRVVVDTRAANIVLSAGETFVIDLSEGNGAYRGVSVPYGGGDLWITDPVVYTPPLNWTVADGGPSLRFETYMDAAVPEPATWAMMIAGFGLAGVALRRRRAAVA